MLSCTARKNREHDIETQQSKEHAAQPGGWSNAVGAARPIHLDLRTCFEAFLIETVCGIHLRRGNAQLTTQFIRDGTQH